MQTHKGAAPLLGIHREIPVDLRQEKITDVAVGLLDLVYPRPAKLGNQTALPGPVHPLAPPPGLR